MDRRRICLTWIVPLAGCLCLLPTRVEARHEVHSVHQEFQERIRALHCWYREAREHWRCQYEQDRMAIEEDLRTARRLCGHERDHRVEVLLAALERVHCHYRDEKRELHERFTCQLKDIEAWYRLALHAESHHAHSHPLFAPWH